MTTIRLQSGCFLVAVGRDEFHQIRACGDAMEPGHVISAECPCVPMLDFDMFIKTDDPASLYIHSPRCKCGCFMVRVR